MSRSGSVRLPWLAAALIPCLASAALPSPDAAWQEALARLGRPPVALGPALEQSLGGLTSIEAAALGLPEGRAALAAELGRAGLTAGEQAVLVPALVDSAQRAAAGDGRWEEPLIGVGPFELTLPQLAFVVGPREGREREAVIGRLRRVAPPGDTAGMPHEAMLALVPDLVAAFESASTERLLARLRPVFFTEADQ